MQLEGLCCWGLIAQSTVWVNRVVVNSPKFDQNDRVIIVDVYRHVTLAKMLGTRAQEQSFSMGRSVDRVFDGTGTWHPEFLARERFF